MDARAPRRSFSFRDYLELEESSNTKHEYYQGEIYAMAGGSPEHAALAVAIASAMLTALRGGPCRVYSSDLRVRVTETGLATYPDVAVVCGELEVDKESPATVTNPAIVVEVLSPSTEEYDRGEKLEHYQRIASLQACILLRTDRRSVELVERTRDGWATRTLAPGDRLVVSAIGLSLSVADVYEDAGL